jgi:hypothetical protein
MILFRVSAIAIKVKIPKINNPIPAAWASPSIILVIDQAMVKRARRAAMIIPSQDSQDSLIWVFDFQLVNPQTNRMIDVPIIKANIFMESLLS